MPNIQLRNDNVGTPNDVWLYNAQLTIAQTLTATMSFTGTIPREAQKTVTAGLSLTGAMTKLVSMSWNSSITFNVSMTKLVSKTHTAGLLFTGFLRKEIPVVFNAVADFTGFLKMTSGFIIATVGGIGMGGGGITSTKKLKKPEDKVTKAVAVATMRGDVRQQIETLISMGEQERRAKDARRTNSR